MLVQAALGFSMQLLLSEADYAMSGIRPAVARLANAMIAALGPELRLGSPVYNQCRAIIREMQVCILMPNPYRTLTSVARNWCRCYAIAVAALLDMIK